MKRCPKCFGNIRRIGHIEKPFYCPECKEWFSNEEVTPKLTNADYIRSMIDEELADWYFDKFFLYVPYCSILEDGCPEHDDCKICLLEWLKKESEDE